MTSPERIWQDTADALRVARDIVVFTGAGISAESGIATFRDVRGFWTEFPPEQFANWAGLLKLAATDPHRLGEFLLAILEPVARAKPNPGHRAIAALEEHASVTVVTQNIDGLHQAAGSTTVKEIHGTLLETVDLFTGRIRERLSRRELQEIANVVRSAMSGSLATVRLMAAVQPLLGFDLKGGHRPNLVLFGDALAEPAWSESLEAARRCDTFVAVGTSGEVYPAATLPFVAQSGGAIVITVDPSARGIGLHLRGTAGDVLPRLLQHAFGDVLPPPPG